MGCVHQQMGAISEYLRCVFRFLRLLRKQQIESRDHVDLNMDMEGGIYGGNRGSGAPTWPVVISRLP